MDITSKLLNDWANGARNSFLESSIDPSVSVKEIVEDNDLNYKQAQRLCEATNLSIKRALRKSEGPDDVQFPLASIGEVWGSTQNDGMGEVSKEASHRPDSFLEKYASHFFDRHEVKKETNQELTLEKLAMVVEGLIQRTRQARRKVSLGEHEFEKVANEILGYIKDEARATGSVSEGYTVVSSLLPKHAELIDRLYKFAQSTLEVDIVGIPDPEMIKNASWVPNPDSQIVQLFTKYAGLYHEVQGARKDFAQCKTARDQTEDKLRLMILGGE